jgi:hypothetical protein
MSNLRYFRMLKNTGTGNNSVKPILQREPPCLKYLAFTGPILKLFANYSIVENYRNPLIYRKKLSRGNY